MNPRRLPSHGPIACRQCWQGRDVNAEYTTSDGRFRVVNDPGAWGCAEPSVLVLGISKGFTQARAFAMGDFDTVPFKDCRDRLKRVLEVVGVMDAGADIDAAMGAGERHFGWGSLVRCSLSGWNARKGAFGAGTPEVLPAFKHPEASRFLQGCMRKYLADLPDTVSLVVLLGNDNRYIEIVAEELIRLHGQAYERINPVAHRVCGRPWVHVAHPSRGNGFFGQFVSGAADTGQGLKRELARAAINLS